MKTSLLLLALLLLASTAQAQRHHGGYVGGWGAGGSLGPVNFGTSIPYEPPREFTLSYARNDGPYVPSTYMDYNEVLALGKQQLAAAQQSPASEEDQALGDDPRSRRAEPYVPSTYMDYNQVLALGKRQLAAQKSAANGEGLPLGDVARILGAARIPTLRLKSIVVQDSSGKLQVCNLNGNDCHRP